MKRIRRTTLGNSGTPACKLMMMVFISILLSACSDIESEVTNCSESDADISFLIAGDAIITQPWSHVNGPEFTRLIETIRKADVALVNLEMLIHEYHGYAQAASGGTYMAANPEIARELKWAGFDLVAHANNHTFDYGSIGVLESLSNVREAGLVSAGAGENLQEARAPAYFQTAAGTVALVSTASTFIKYGKASRARPDFHGRPGLNPLTVTWTKNINLFQSISLTVPYTLVNNDDLEGNLRAIRDAATKADFVVLSIHAHIQGPWLETFARQAIDAGADIFFAHGPHELRGVELYKCKPIFYGLGDFVYQYDQVARLPSEYYALFGLGDEATPQDAHKALLESGNKKYKIGPKAYEGVVAKVRLRKGGLNSIEFLPIDLGFAKLQPFKGMPQLADRDLGRKIIADLKMQSQKYGTRIDYLESNNVGAVNLH